MSLVGDCPPPDCESEMENCLFSLLGPGFNLDHPAWGGKKECLGGSVKSEARIMRKALITCEAQLQHIKTLTRGSGGAS